MTTAEKETQSAPDPLQPYLSKPLHLFVCDSVLREQLRIILSAMKFERVKIHPSGKSYVDSVRGLAFILLKEEGVFLVGPPTKALGEGKGERDLINYFANVSALLTKANRDPLKLLSRCAPVFPDIEFTQKRENTIVALAEFGVTGAFILKQRESLSGLHPQRKKVKMREQVLARFNEIRDYLLDYLPGMDEALDALMEKREEQELSRQKAEADKWVEEAEKFKKSGDLDQAISCYKKAMDLFPSDPHAYLESGKVFVRIKKYTHALKRFRQAEDIAEHIPEPNKEIANVRIVQVRERIERGEDPENPEITVMLDEALENYGSALNKAENIRRRHNASDKGKSADAVAKIAGDIFKQDLESLLGKEHPAVKKLGALARDSLMTVLKKGEGEIPPAQHVFLGLAAMDGGDFKAAERHFLTAAKDPAHFSEACIEMNLMGQVIRRRKGPDEAIELYQRLLGLKPPLRGPVYFNLAVAYAVKGEEPEAAGNVVQALYIDPALAEDDLFYRNYQLYKTIEFVFQTFDSIMSRADQVEIPDQVKRDYAAREELMSYILHKDDKQGIKLLWKLAASSPDFFKRKELLANKLIMEYIAAKSKLFLAAPKPEPVKIGKFLQGVLATQDKIEIPDSTASLVAAKIEITRAMELKGEQDLAANLLGNLLSAFPEIAETESVYADETLYGLAREIRTKMDKIELNRIDHPKH